MTDVITTESNDFHSLDHSWSKNDGTRRIEWTGGNPPHPGDLVLAYQEAWQVDGNGGPWNDGGEIHRYVYLQPIDADVDEILEDVPNEKRPTWARDDVSIARMSANPGEGTTVDVSGDGEWKTVLGGHWSCNECGGQLDHKNSRCRCGLVPSRGIGVTFHAKVRDATDQEVRVEESKRRRQTIRRVGKAARRNHRKSVFTSRIREVKERDDLVKTQVNPEGRNVPSGHEVEEDETVAKLPRESGRRRHSKRLTRLIIDGDREGYVHRQGGGHYAYYLPEDVHRDAALASAEESGKTPESAREWLEDYEGCKGTEDERFIAQIDDDSTEAQRLRLVSELYDVHERLQNLLHLEINYPAKTLVKNADESERVDGTRYEIDGGLRGKRVRPSNYLVVDDPEDPERIEYEIGGKTATIVAVEDLEGDIDVVLAFAKILDDAADGYDKYLNQKVETSEGINAHLPVQGHDLTRDGGELMDILNAFRPGEAR